MFYGDMSMVGDGPLIKKTTYKMKRTKRKKKMGRELRGTLVDLPKRYHVHWYSVANFP